MKFGMYAPYAVDPKRPGIALEEGPQAIAFAQTVEALGFESVWLVEHTIMFREYASAYPYAPRFSPYAAEVPQPDPLAWLSYVAGATEHLLLGTGILILPQRNPVTLAKSVATTDRLSGGRMLLGIGVGWLREEAEALGAPFENRGRRTDEYIQVMRTLWREPVAGFKGEFVSFDGAVSEPKPARPEGVPILVGGHSAAAARRAGRLGDGFFPLGIDLDELPGMVEIARASAREHGRDASAIEVTCLGPLDAEAIPAFEAAGVDRMIVSPPPGHLETVRPALQRFASAAIGS